MTSNAVPRSGPRPPASKDSRTVSGILVVEKPRGMTSHDIVDLVRQKLGTRRIGHTGTLDPMAEGVLVLLVGQATKWQSVFQTHEKIYETTIRFGLHTDTQDAWGKPLRTASVPPLERSTVSSILRSVVGRQEQVVPAFSAVKVGGRPAYWWARRGKSVSLPARTVEIFAIELLGLTADSLTLRVRCSKGTYIRSLACAIAQRIGTVGHVSRLTRLAAGPFQRQDAVSVVWIQTASLEAIVARLQSPESLHPVRLHASPHSRPSVSHVQGPNA